MRLTCLFQGQGAEFVRAVVVLRLEIPCSRRAWLNKDFICCTAALSYHGDHCRER